MKRSGMTVIELLVIVAIVAILFGIICSNMSGCTTTYYKNKTTADFQCVKTYTVNVNEHKSSKRVDLRPIEGGPVQTFNVDDDLIAGVRNSATLYAQFEQGKLYRVTSVGYRQEGYYAMFPLVTAVHEILDPRISDD